MNRQERLREESAQFEELGDQQVLDGNNTAADAAYVLSDERYRESLFTTPIY